MARRGTTRKSHRKTHRKTHRKGSRKSHGGSRRGLFSTIYAPVSHLIQAAEESVSAVTDTSRNVVRRGLRGVNNVGKSVTGHANAAVRNVVSRKNRQGSRKNRRN